MGGRSRSSQSQSTSTSTTNQAVNGENRGNQVFGSNNTVVSTDLGAIEEARKLGVSAFDSASEMVDDGFKAIRDLGENAFDAATSMSEQGFKSAEQLGEGAFDSANHTVTENRRLLESLSGDNRKLFESLGEQVFGTSEAFAQRAADISSDAFKLSEKTNKYNTEFAQNLATTAIEENGGLAKDVVRELANQQRDAITALRNVSTSQMTKNSEQLESIAALATSAQTGGASVLVDAQSKVMYAALAAVGILGLIMVFKS